MKSSHGVTCTALGKLIYSWNGFVFSLAGTHVARISGQSLCLDLSVWDSISLYLDHPPLPWTWALALCGAVVQGELGVWGLWVLTWNASGLLCGALACTSTCCLLLPPWAVTSPAGRCPSHCHALPHFTPIATKTAWGWVRLSSRGRRVDLWVIFHTEETIFLFYF